MAVRDSARWVANRAQDVSVDEERCNAIASKLEPRIAEYSTAKWSEPLLHPKAKTPATVAWIFTIDTLNFSFWSIEPYGIEYKKTTYTGYWALAAAINRALDEGIQITDPKTWQRHDFPEIMARVFRSSTDSPVPMLAERIAVLREAGSVLGNRQFSEILLEQGSSAAKTIEWLAKNLPSYDDTAIYDGERVEIYKRAQILVADLWACFNGSDWGYFYDIDTLTMFADYRVPQILWNLGCISYSSDLETRIRRGDIMQSKENAEIELRACSIWGVELIVSKLRKDGIKANSILVDFFLWDLAKQEESKTLIPCHRVRSVYY